jgi:transcriptional regulator with XRE-family HTH domain
MDIVCTLRDDLSVPVCHNATVEERNHLKAWRKKRGLTLEELAEKVGTTRSVIYLLETEQRPLSAKWLRKLALALGTTPGRILDVDPDEANADVLDIWDHIAKRDRPAAARILRSLTGTND